MRALARRAVFCLGGLVLALVLGIATASPASAHTLSGPKPSNYRARITSVDPPASGVVLRVLEFGARLELTNHTDTDVLVLGYDGEPYLRIGPLGVFENLHSPATYLNRSVQGGVVPDGVSVGREVPPEWRKLSDSQVGRWHDHNAHWMRPGLPPQVVENPNAFHRLSVTRVRFIHNGTTSNATITLDWVPAPNGVRWLLVAIAAFTLALGATIVGRRFRVVAMLVGVVVLLDATHAIAYGIVRPGTNFDKAAHFFGNAFVSILVWIAAIPTMIGLWRRRSEALYGAIFVGLMVALVGGASDLSVLWHSQLPAAGPDVLTRLEVVLALAIGGGVAIGALTRVVSAEDSRAARDPAPVSAARPSDLVVGLSEDELRRIAADLDVDAVLASALSELAARLQPYHDAFAEGSLALQVVADDEAARHVWSISARGDEVSAQPGVHEPVKTELAVAFPVLLQLLAGTASLDRAVQSGRVSIRGDRASAMHIAAHFAERVDDACAAPSPPTRRAPAS
jgi:SCP-2 sterol transfer family